MVRLFSAMAILLVWVSTPLAATSLPTADLPGTQDSPLLGRYEGSVIVSYEHKDFDEFTMPISALERVDGKRDSHNNIYFNKADIRPESEPTLEQIAKLLHDHPGMNLLVVGHTDNVGTFAFNQDLSQRRAGSVVSALVRRHGIAENRLTPVGVSFACPVASNKTDEGRAKNRRVELVEP